MSFASLGLAPEFLRAVADQGYTEPTPVQAAAIPIVIDGRGSVSGLTSLTSGGGDGGTLVLRADSITIRSGAIDSSTSSSGNGGDVEITANTIELGQAAAIGASSFGQDGSVTLPGNAGSIDILRLVR